MAGQAFVPGTAVRTLLAHFRTPLPLAGSLLLNDREYRSRLVKTALPIALQALISSGLYALGVLLIGQLGEVAIAAAGLGNQLFFLSNFLLFGITSGTALFSAQLWGSRDLAGIHRVLGLTLLAGLLGAGLFFTVAEFFPSGVLRFYTADTEVIAAGSLYLRIIAPSFLLMAVGGSYAATLRATGDVRTPLLVSMIALSFNMLLAYLLIFGRLGLPRLGLYGAAWAMLVARALECGLMLALASRRTSAAAAPLRELAGFDFAFARRVMARALPVAINEMLWSLGVTTYNAIYAHIGTESLAAVSIAGTVESMAFVAFIGISDACAILIGHRIGEGDEEKAFRYAVTSLLIAMTGALLMGGLILAVSGGVLSLYKVSPQVLQVARRILWVIALALFIKVGNMTIYVGILRAGGDTRFAMLVDVLAVWLVGVPLTAFGAFVLRLPVIWVYPLILSEEIVKWGIGASRIASRRWIHNVTRTDQGKPLPQSIR